MTALKFQIPGEFADQLTYNEPSDKRSDAEILDALSVYQPVTSEKNTWCYWHSGIKAMPPWCQRNIADWVRINPSWTIRILDSIPDSPNHFLKYTDSSLLPETLLKGTMDGPYVGPHTSDFLRGACLFKHGGVYMDVGIVMIRDLDRMGWTQLANSSSSKQICVPVMYGTLTANSWVMSRKGDPFIKRWHDLFVYVWKDRTNYEGLSQHPLVASTAVNIDFSESVKKGYAWEFIVGPRHVFEYITQTIAWSRLCMIEDPNDGFNGPDYVQDNILWYDALSENWGAETVVGFAGQQFFDALATRLDSDPESQEYKTAYRLVWRMLTKSSMEKITHGKGLTKTPALGLLWDMKDNENKDCEVGTFAELLRFGCRHFRQTRDQIEWVQTEKPEKTVKKGLFEP
jgi:hypothetical protein